MFRLLLLGLALTMTSALQIAVGTTHAVARAPAVRMALPKLDDARNLSTDEIEQEIAAAKKVRASRRRWGSRGFERVGDGRCGDIFHGRSELESTSVVRIVRRVGAAVVPCLTV